MNLNKTRKVKTDMFTATLRGDGSTVPELIIESNDDGDKVHRYVDSSDLRELGEKFLKWADKLDAHSN